MSEFIPFSVVPNKPLAKELVDNLELRGEAYKDAYGYNYNGRMGTHMPLNNGADIGIGVSGHGYKYGDYKDASLNSVDLSYKNNLDEFKAKFTQLSPEDKAIYLEYIHNF